MPEEHNSELPSIEDIVGQTEELPSVDEFIELEEEEVEEETQIIDDAEGNAKIEVVDVIQAPEWGEVLRLINDVRESIPEIPEIPEIKTYDEELKAICEIIDDVRESIPVVPEVRYYEDELETIRESVQSVKDSIPTLPVWIEKVSEVPDFTWVGQTFNTVDERFKSIKDCVETLSSRIEDELSRIQEEKDTLAFESKTDFKNVHDRVGSLKDQIYGQLKEQSDIIWKLQKKLKENQKEFEIVITDRVENKVDHLQEVTTETAKRLQTSLNEKFESVGNKLDEEVDSLKTKLSGLPKPKYYEEELNKIRKELKNFESLREIVEQIQVRQEKVEDLRENYLLNEPPEEAENIGSGQDPLTPMDQKFATLSDLASHYRIFINRIQTQLSTMGGGGAGFIKDLDDVDITGLADNYILQYDATSSKWLTVANNAGAGGTWAVTDVGIHTSKNVGIATTARSDSALYVEGNATVTGNLNVTGDLVYDEANARNWNVSGVATATKLHVGVDTGFFNEDLVVNGDARVTGILTIGESSITLDPNAKQITGIDQVIVGSGVSVSLAPLFTMGGDFVIDYSELTLRGYSSLVNGTYTRQTDSFVLGTAPTASGSARFQETSGYYYFLHESDNSKMIIYNTVDGSWSAVFSSGSNFSSPSSGTLVNPITVANIVGFIRESYDDTGRAYPAAVGGIEYKTTVTEQTSSLGIITATSLEVTGIATVSTAFYMPQYTTSARDAATFAEGAMIYNTTTKKMEFYNGTSWQSLPGMTLGLALALDG